MSDTTPKPERDEEEQHDTAVERDECCAESECCQGNQAESETASAGAADGAACEDAESVTPADEQEESLADLEVDLDDLDPRDAEIAQLKDDLAHAQADFLNLQNEYGKYVRRAKAEAPALRAYGHIEVAQTLLSVLDDIQAARDHGELTDGPFAAIAAKLESTLESKFKLERYGSVGENFDPHQHEALMAQTSADVEVATVGQVLQPGYRMGERVLRAAKVLVHNPE